MCDRDLFRATLRPFDAWTSASEVDLRSDLSGFGVATNDVLVARPR